MNTFTLLGKGDVHRTLAATPILLVVQILLLPIFLWLMLESDTSRMVTTRPFVQAFLGRITVTHCGFRSRTTSAPISLNSADQCLASQANVCSEKNVTWVGSFL